jgi:hypothetical protein
MFSRNRACPTRGFLRWRPTDNDGKVYVNGEMELAGMHVLQRAVDRGASPAEIVRDVYEAMTETRLRFKPSDGSSKKDRPKRAYRKTGTVKNGHQTVM